MAAIENHHLAIEWSSVELKNDEDFISTAVSKEKTVGLSSSRQLCDERAVANEPLAIQLGICCIEERRRKLSCLPSPKTVGHLNMLRLNYAGNKVCCNGSTLKKEDDYMQFDRCVCVC
mmetsp:Transcript_5770/g.8852  ORF Transcript_5770/g.8852 Transcript_5770/m.8852 type:complete len:118 (+) Transcript_5770:241-594(+)